MTDLYIAPHNTPLNRMGPNRDEALIAQQSLHRFTAATLTDVASLRAELAAIRAAGHAFDREEHEQGIICAAVPVRVAGGRCVGALSVTGTTGRVGQGDLAACLPALRRAAAGIARDMQAWRFPDAPATRGGERTCPE